MRTASVGTICRALGIVTAGAFALQAAPARAENAPQSLIYAVYDNDHAAMDTFKAMQQAQREQVIHMQSYAVISKDANGKVRVQRSNQKTGTIAGAAIGGLIGAIGGPAGAAAGATAGGTLGYATGSAFGIPRQDINAIKASLAPGNSALIAVVEERWVNDVQRSLQQTEARSVLTSKIEQRPAGAGTPAPSGAPGTTTPSVPDTTPPPPQP